MKISQLVLFSLRPESKVYVAGRIVGETRGGKYLVRNLTAPRHILVRSSEELREITGEGNEADSIARDAD